MRLLGYDQLMQTVENEASQQNAYDPRAEISKAGICSIRESVNSPLEPAPVPASTAANPDASPPSSQVSSPSYEIDTMGFEETNGSQSTWNHRSQNRRLAPPPSPPLVYQGSRVRVTRHQAAQNWTSPQGNSSLDRPVFRMPSPVLRSRLEREEEKRAVEDQRRRNDNGGYDDGHGDGLQSRGVDDEWL
ncbi:MAG: hypothetical protein ASARMPREDX12_002435 [Alectoria sarmentosa]|nr:MAG: hypothetical protein ASARMPREDX12_002435 [Alectoria sarmentosa]